MLLTPGQALESIIQEYPSLEGYSLNISKQFSAGVNRLSNAFLILSDHPNEQFRTFVAKGAAPHTSDNSSLLVEWQALQLVGKHTIPSPSLLFPRQRPKEFLLISFVEGTNPADSIQAGNPPDLLFREIGKTLAELHRIESPRFGALIEDKDTDWTEYINRKIRENGEACAPIIGEELAARMEDLGEKLFPTLEQERELSSVLIHRDIYLHNFIMDAHSGRASLIDFGMAFGGRPLYDLAKLYIIDLCEQPEYRDDFLAGYSESQLPDQELLSLYILREPQGMIKFYDTIGQTEQMNRAISLLSNLIDGTGIITELLNQPILSSHVHRPANN